MKSDRRGGTALVVISHYNAWSSDQLVALLDQVRAIPSGHPFGVRVVVNRAEDKPLELPDRHSNVEILYRENTGYNIGAWNFGWREPPKADAYLFLQEECVIRKPGWLKAYLSALERPGVGMVGEILEHRFATWEEVSRDPNSPWNLLEWTGEGDQPKDWAVETKAYLEAAGIEPGPTIGHLQSLVIAARLEVLEAIGGFRVGLTKDEAIASEVAITKMVEATGWKVRQVSIRPFEYILHPQWEDCRLRSAGVGWWVRRVLRDYVKQPLRTLAARRVQKTVNRA